MEAVPYLEAFYKTEDEDARLASRHGSVEFLTTMRYIQKYGKSGDRIIDIGAGTGRYAHALAEESYRVDAVELTEHNIDIFRANTKPGKPVTITQANAMDLRGFPDDTYDITLLLGPLYHLFTTEDKLRALREAIRVTRRGGLVFAAYCIAFPSILDYGFKQGHIFELIEKNMLDPKSFKTFSKPWDLFELHRREDIDELMRGFEVTRLHYVAADGYTKHMRDAVDNMDAETFALYLNYHFSVCEREDMTGLTHHALDIFRKD